MDDWMVGTGVVNLLATPIYLYVGLRLFGRPVVGRARFPLAQFSLWWCGVGATGALVGLGQVLGAYGLLTFSLEFTVYLLTILLDVVILWGLVGYLVYLYTGKYYLLALSAFYGAFYIATLYWVVASGPYAIGYPAGVPTLLYGHVLGGPIFAFVVLGLLGPELIATVLYFSLIRRTTDRTLRYRIVLVSASIGLFFALAFVTPPASVLAPEAWTLAKSVLDVVAGLLSLIAYVPPVSLQRRLRIEAVARPELPGTERGAPS